MFCTSCGNKIDKSVSFCSFCGVKNKKPSRKFKRCPFCGEKNNIKDESCSYCSRVLIEKIKITQENLSNSVPSPKHRKELIFSKFFNRLKGVNYFKLILNKYIFLIIFIAFIIWVYSGDYSHNVDNVNLPPPKSVNMNSNSFAEFAPPPVTSLDNGTIIKKNNIYFNGDGELQIKNGSNLDAVGKLIIDGMSVFTVYIKSNNNYTIKGISDGVYWLAFSQGLGWNSTEKKFKQNVQYSVFDETFDFKIIRENNKYYSTIFEVTLHPILGGEAETSSVDPGQFNSY